jgi:hypothetical protein
MVIAQNRPAVLYVETNEPSLENRRFKLGNFELTQYKKSDTNPLLIQQHFAKLDR